MFINLLIYVHTNRQTLINSKQMTVQTLKLRYDNSCRDNLFHQTTSAQETNDVNFETDYETKKTCLTGHIFSSDVGTSVNIVFIRWPRDMPEVSWARTSLDTGL